MAYTFDVRTDVGKLRLLIPDRDATEPFFQDGELEAFLALEGDVRRATALALETLASDEALTLHAVQLLDLQTDGTKVSAALLTRAATLRGQAEAAELAEEGAAFDVVELVPNSFAWRERVWNEALRDG